jgi:hypothetical protein
MRILVLYYSFTGNTQKVANAIADRLGAELGEITCQAYYAWNGPLLQAMDIFTRRLPRVEVLTPPHVHYDLTVIGAPVWAGRPAPPALRALREHKSDIGRAALFVTCRGANPTYGPERALDEMAAAVEGPVVAVRAFREPEIRTGDFRQGIEEFVQTLGVPVAARGKTIV